VLKEIINYDQMEYLKISPNKSILVLNSSYDPINFTNWKRAVVLLLKEKAQVLSNTVIRLLNYIKIPFKVMNKKPSRGMIYKRDNHTCQYCGSKKRLTIDHVIPKSKGGKDTWENMVVACSRCNIKKSDTLLEQTGMKLFRVPKAPFNVVSLNIIGSDNEEWQKYCLNN
jgi:5-methylcytosine-specific restriction endonuclease McrA